LQSEIHTAEAEIPKVCARVNEEKKSAKNKVITLVKDIGFIEYAVSRNT
jgi:hypothetical protein